MRNHAEVIFLTPKEQELYTNMENSFLDEKGLTKILPWNSWKEFPSNCIKRFCMEHDLWVIPTEELVCKLDELMPNAEECLEIGCGLGIIGRELDCILTDSKLHGSSKVPIPINYPNDVEELDGVSAAQKYKPHTVLACHCVPLWQETHAVRFIMKHHKDAGGSMYGVDYKEVLKNCKQLIAVAHKDLLDLCNILKLPHQELKNVYGVVNRSLFQLTIYIWKNGKKI